MEGFKAGSTKVLMTTDTVGGVWTYTMELCKALSAYNVHFYLITLGASLQDFQRRELGMLANVTTYETEYKLEWMEEPWDDIDHSGQWLLELERLIQPDLIHLNCYSYGALPFNAPKLIVCHSDVYSWFRAVKGADPGPEWSEYFNRVQKGLNGADLVIAPSKTVLAEVVHIYNLSTRTQVIYNFRSPDRFSTGPKRQTVMSIGRLWDEAKNIKLLIDAAPNIASSIAIAGDKGFENHEIEAFPNNIEYMGKLSSEKAADVLSNASVYVLPAKYEPFGLSALEAALSGCVLVLGNIASLREIWEDNALYVNTDDPKELAEIVTKLLDYETLVAEYAQRAFSHAKKYSPANACEYLSAYQSVLKIKNDHKTKALA